MTFDPLFKVLVVIFLLGTGRHSIWLEKIILGCKFHILGIKTTLGQHIAKNLPVYYPSFILLYADSNLNGAINIIHILI